MKMTRRTQTERIIKRRLFIIEKIWFHGQSKQNNNLAYFLHKQIKQQNRLKKTNLNCNSSWCHPKTRLWGLPIRDKKRIPADVN